jgi:hypothetical protein
LRRDLEIGLDEDRHVPQVSELGPVQKDAIAGDDRVRGSFDAQDMGAELPEVECIEVVASGESSPRTYRSAIGRSN